MKHPRPINHLHRATLYEGLTQFMSAKQLSETIEYYGASFSAGPRSAMLKLGKSRVHIRYYPAGRGNWGVQMKKAD